MSIADFGHVAMNQTDGPASVSDRALRLFDAAARLGSFSEAARSVGVGQPAVSHAVAKLEAAIGEPVFVRSSTGVALTTTGRELHDAVRGAFGAIDHALATAMQRTPLVTLSVSTSFASYWLMPRLAEFKLAHAGTELRVITCDSDRSVGNDDADLWVPLGVVTRPDLVATELCAERVVAVCAPELATPELVDGLPDSISTVPMLHLEERYASRLDWNRWLAAHGVDDPSTRTSNQAYRSNDYSLVLQAAIAGDGIALGWLHIVGDLIDSGRLVAIGRPVETDTPFMILRRTTSSQRDSVDDLQQWLHSTMVSSLSGRSAILGQ